MLLKIIFFIIGFFLMVFGNFYIIIYINLFSFGYNIIEYLEFIFSRYECYCTIIGFIFIILAVYMKGDK